MLEEVYADARRRMGKAVEALKGEFSRLRTGRATPALLEGIKVEAYGSVLPLNQVATISAPEPRLLVVQPWDQSIAGEIERAILKSGLGLTPQVSKGVIRIPIPPLTEERRQELVKLAKKMAEDARVAIRNVRRDAIERVRQMEKNKEISEDERKAAEKEIQKITDEHIERVNELLEKKEKEILEF